MLIRNACWRVSIRVRDYGVHPNVKTYFPIIDANDRGEAIIKAERIWLDYARHYEIIAVIDVEFLHFYAEHSNK
jgi:hypothetical protein